MALTLTCSVFYQKDICNFLKGGKSGKKIYLEMVEGVKQMSFYHRAWLGLFLSIFLSLLLGGCSGIRWQMKETVFLVYEVEPYSSEGTVIPIPGALVAVSGESFSGVKYTDSTGRVVFQLAPGTYTIQVSKDGYFPVSDSITIYTLELTPGTYYHELIPQGGQG